MNTSRTHCEKISSLTMWIVALGLVFPALVVSSTYAFAAVENNSPPASQGSNASPTNPAVAANSTPPEQRIFIRTFHVQGGGKILPKLAVEEAVYPFLGPYRTVEDVEGARAALEKVYRDQGFQTVEVEIPAQTAQQVKSGVILLTVVPNPVGRLRVIGSTYHSISEIENQAPSLQEGKVINFNDVTHDLVNLNQLGDCEVTPSVLPGRTPGTVDVDLNVKDSNPLHGSFEVNNRYSADTSPLRMNASASYDNLWQMGHTISGSFQVSPQNPSQVEVFSGYYLAPIPDVSGLSLMLTGTDQNSSVSTLSGIGVAGIGQTIGLNAILALPSRKDFYHSVTLGFDYKHYQQDVMIGGSDTPTPITYYPLSAAYSATWMGKNYETDFNGAINLHLRGMGSNEVQFDNDRYGADGSYIYFRGDVSQKVDLPENLQIFGKVQGQAADQPLINNEQFSGGGLDTVRGYLESEVLGDNALLASTELRSPSLGTWIGSPIDDWRFYIFGEGGLLAINEPLPDQQAKYTLASIGAGTRIKMQKHFNGSLDMGVPLLKGIQTNPYNILLTFRVWAEF